MLGADTQVARERPLPKSGAERKLGSKLGHYLSYPDRAVDRDISHYDASAGAETERCPARSRVVAAGSSGTPIHLRWWIRSSGGGLLVGG